MSPDDEPIPSSLERAALGWDEVYRDGRAPWDIGRPQPAFVRIADAGEVASPVLDCGCGTGEQTLMLAARGYEVLGVDLSPTAVETARRKAREQEVEATFAVANALDLRSLERRFATVIDSGVFHVFNDEDRARYVVSLASVLDPGGVIHLACFSELTPGPGGPRRVTQAELRAAFADGWEVERIEAARFEVRAVFGSEVHPTPGWRGSSGARLADPAHLEQERRLAHPAQLVGAELPEGDPGRQLVAERGERRAGDDGLASARHAADAVHGVHRDADVARIGQGRASRVDANPDVDRRTLRPGVIGEGAVNGRRRDERPGRPLEDREILVRAGVHLLPPGTPHDRAQVAPELGEERRIGIPELVEQARRIDDVRHQEGDRPAWERARPGYPQLALHETNGDDPVPARRTQQPAPCPITGGLVLEEDLVEAGQRVSNVRLVMNREPPAATRVDVGERAVAQRPWLLRAELRHASMVPPPAAVLASM